MIDQIRLNRTISELYNAYWSGSKEEIDFFNLSQINLFIGQNNSGKSRLLRAIFFDLSQIQMTEASEFRDDLLKSRVSINGIKKQVLVDLLIDPINQLDSFLGSNTVEAWTVNFFESQKDVLFQFQIDNIQKLFFKYLGSINHNNFYDSSINQKELEGLCKKVLEVIKSKNTSYSFKDVKITYIPAFRTLRKYQLIAVKEEYYGKKVDVDEIIEQNIFKNKTILDYFKNKNSLNTSDFFSKPEYIFTGEDLYEVVRNLRNSPYDKRKTLIEFENFLSEIYFDNVEIELHAIENNKTKDVYVKIKEKEFPIYNLGDGIQSIIILTFPLFLNQHQEHIVFIEEPELYLHPGMQRIYLQTIAKFPKTKCFITSHSNHFLELSLEYPELISIYSLKHSRLEKEKTDFLIEHLSSPTSALLTNLGVRNSSVFLVNSTIWVEGISDRIYISKYLSLFVKENPDGLRDIKNLMEDFHYSFIEFSGNNITHWDFSETTNEIRDHMNAFKIANRIFLIHDKDDKKDQRHSLLKAQLGDNYYPLPCREVENLLSPHVIKNTINNYYRRYKDVEVIFNEFSQTDYKEILLGDFLPTLYQEDHVQKFISIGSDKIKREIYNKVDFARKAVSNINTWQDLSEDAKILTRRLYGYIIKNN